MPRFVQVPALDRRPCLLRVGKRWGGLGIGAGPRPGRVRQRRAAAAPSTAVTAIVALLLPKRRLRMWSGSRFHQARQPQKECAPTAGDRVMCLRLETVDERLATFP